VWPGLPSRGSAGSVRTGRGRSPRWGRENHARVPYGDFSSEKLRPPISNQPIISGL
jgi:hypothetical protein